MKTPVSFCFKQKICIKCSYYSRILSPVQVFRLSLPDSKAACFSRSLVRTHLHSRSPEHIVPSSSQLSDRLPPGSEKRAVLLSPLPPELWQPHSPHHFSGEYLLQKEFQPSEASCIPEYLSRFLRSQIPPAFLLVFPFPDTRTQHCSSLL